MGALVRKPCFRRQIGAIRFFPDLDTKFSIETDMPIVFAANATPAAGLGYSPDFPINV